MSNTSATESSSPRKKAKKPGRLAQMRTAFDLTRRHDRRLVPYMLLAFVGSVVLSLILGLIFKNWITFLILGILLGLLGAMLVLSMRAQSAALTQLEGQAGGAGAALSLLRRGWIVPQQPVNANPKTKDLIFRAIGRPGVVLVTEGPSQRVSSLVNAEKLKLRRLVPDVPVHVIHAGSAEGQVALKNIPSAVKKLPRGITKEEVYAVDKRLTSLGGQGLPIPKGIDPQRVRGGRKNLRGR